MKDKNEIRERLAELHGEQYYQDVHGNHALIEAESLLWVLDKKPDYNPPGQHPLLDGEDKLDLSEYTNE